MSTVFNLSRLGPLLWAGVGSGILRPIGRGLALMRLALSPFLCLPGTTGNVLSFSETRAHQVVQQKSEQFMIYNQKQLTRIYPSAYRIDSSNFNPLPYWNAGCQLGEDDPRGGVRRLLSPPCQSSVVSNPLKRSIFTVALNYQSEGRMMQINRAKFKANGNCGYILKPQQMCKGEYQLHSCICPKQQMISRYVHA